MGNKCATRLAWRAASTSAALSAAGEILTVGHSTHPLEDFVALLRGADVELVADVRRYPGSRRNPQFGAEALSGSLADAGIDYKWLGEALGGRRSTSASTSVDNSAWRNAAFRAYADHMWAPEFAAGLQRLERLARERRTAVMCAEAHPSRCHRRLIADALLARGWTPIHLLPDGRLEAHAPSPHAVIADGRVSYPTQPTLDL
jgi:uncharacterized protein (DUF488 family)